MEKKKQLDACYRSACRWLILAFTSCIVIFGSSCALPRIAILSDPLTPEEHINLGVSYEKSGNYEAALEQYREAIDSSQSGKAWTYIGNVYVQWGKMDEAEDAYKKALFANSESAETLNNLAWLYYMERRELERAEALARRAVDLGGEHAESYRDTLQAIEALTRGNE